MPLVYFSCVIWREMLERFSSAKVCACVCIINFCLHSTLLCKLLCYQPLIIIRETERERERKVAKLNLSLVQGPQNIVID